MNRKYMPYGFDENYEYKTYRNIGKDYGDSRTANAGHIENIKRYFRKKVNKTQKYYATCDTYTQWKNYIKKNTEKYQMDIENYKHWLIKQQCYYEERLELIKIILIPLYIFGLTVLVEKETNNVQILYATIIVETIMCILVMRDTKKSSFYKNYIEILELNIDVENNKE